MFLMRIECEQKAGKERNRKFAVNEEDKIRRGKISPPYFI